MKRIYLTIATLLLSIAFYGQTTFVRKYTHYVSNVNDVKSEQRLGEVTIIFNYKGTNDIKMFVGDKERMFYRSGELEEGKTKNGTSYQIVPCVDKDGEEVYIQVFDDNTRVLYNNGKDYFEYFN